MERLDDGLDLCGTREVGRRLAAIADGSAKALEQSGDRQTLRTIEPVACVRLYQASGDGEESIRNVQFLTRRHHIETGPGEVELCGRNAGIADRAEADASLAPKRIDQKAR